MCEKELRLWQPKGQRSRLLAERKAVARVSWLRCELSSGIYYRSRYYFQCLTENQDCAELTNRLLKYLSIALDLGPEKSLSRYHTGSLFVSNLVHYPAISAQLLRSGEAARNPAHSDFGTLTLLFQRDVGGFEIADISLTNKTTNAAVEKSGKFLHAAPCTETILVNAGHLLMR
jgi:isopenicillin N synthase-like dioxygenase